MWSDNDIDKAFQRLDPPEPAPAPFPLDAWLRLETGLDQAVIERAVRRRLWKFFAAELVVVLLGVLGWLLWPVGTARVAGPASASAVAADAAATGGSGRRASAQPLAKATAPDVAAPATATLLQSAAATDAPVTGVAPASAALRSASTPASPATSPTGPSPTHESSAVARFSIAAASTPRNGRRQADNSRRAVANSRNARQITSRAGASTRNEDTAARGRILHTDSSQASRSTAALAKNTDQRPAAGNLAASTEGPAKALIVAATASQLRRKNQSSLPGQAAGSGSSPATVEPLGVSASNAATGASAAPVARLAPVAVELLRPAPAGLPAPLAAVALGPTDLPAPVRQPRFFVGLVAAPDLSTVKFVDVERPRLSLGVVLEYRLTNRLRVSTGLLRTSKAYYARRQDYDWSAYPRAATRSFDWVDGACTVLDVPLNLRYDAVVRPQARLFGAVGLSSFFMQRERYRYDYTEHDTPYVWERSYVNENRHLLSVLNLSFGYERSLGAHWRVQAEPYAKLPLGGVGAGKVRLTSGGIFFGVKYGF